MPNLTRTQDAVYVLDRETTAQAVNTTTAETTVFTKQIDASLLGTNRLLRFTMTFDYLFNSGTNPTATIRVKLGATTLYAGTTNASVTNSGTRRPGYITLMLNNQNSASVQSMGGIYFYNTTGATTTGLGDIADDEMDSGGFGSIAGSATESTSANKDFVVTIQLSASSSTIEFRKNGAVLELL